jgi:signal transduction histidine kinase
MKGVVMIEPDRLPTNPLPPPVRIEEVIADNDSISQFSASTAVLFGPDKEKFEFHYTALSLVAPEKVRFRYKLEGLDRDWVNPGTRRTAYYTHLPPGTYQFKVRACNNDGVWSEADAAFLFRLKPHFYQTLWFYGFCGVAVLLTGFAAHRLRLRQVRARFDAILAERNRLARELHDTLAQGMTGIISQLDAAEEVSDSPNRSLTHVTRARDLARRNLNEARRAIRAMRPQLLEGSSFLSAFSRTISDLTSNTSLQPDVQITGEDRHVPPVVQDNLLRIAQEAITNCLKHSQAKSVRIELDLNPRSVLLRVADDGIGFDPEKGSSDGHFGLIGMGERVKQLDGEFRVRSSAGQGTEILVSIPLA